MWQENALHDLLNTDLSYREIGEKYGRDRQTIIRLARDHKVVRSQKVKRVGIRPASEMKQISPFHRALGLRLSIYRGLKTYTEIAEELNVSRYVVKMMEIGAHDFTLSQLLRLANVMERPIEDIIRPHKVQTYG